MAIKSIGIDIREATEKGAGKGRYTLELTRALIKTTESAHSAQLNQPSQSNQPSPSFYLFTKKANPLFTSTDRVHQIVISGRGLFWHLNLRRYLKQAPVGIFISPTSVLYPALAPKKQKTAIVVHDLITFLHSKTHPWFPTIVERLTLPHALKKTHLIICVSEHTKKDLHHLFPTTINKATVVVSPAVSPDIYPVDTQKMDLPQDYLLGVGTLLPRKNFSVLIHAFALIHEKYPTLHLCIAGHSAQRSISVHLKNLPTNIRHRLHFLGYVSTPQLCELYTRARMLVFPSTYEGFGIPPLEAMACGCPVIVSNASSLPEVVADAALQVDPHNPVEIAQAIEKMLLTKNAMEYRQKGLKRIQTFSWEKSAQKLLDQLR